MKTFRAVPMVQLLFLAILAMSGCGNSASGDKAMACNQDADCTNPGFRRCLKSALDLAGDPTDLSMVPGGICVPCLVDADCAVHQTCTGQNYTCVTQPWCGDGVCNGGENINNCYGDCKPCMKDCGGGVSVLCAQACPARVGDTCNPGDMPVCPGLNTAICWNYWDGTFAYHKCSISCNADGDCLNLPYKHCFNDAQIMKKLCVECTVDADCGGPHDLCLGQKCILAFEQNLGTFGSIRYLVCYAGSPNVNMNTPCGGTDPTQGDVQAKFIAAWNCMTGNGGDCAAACQQRGPGCANCIQTKWNYPLCRNVTGALDARRGTIETR